MRKKSHLFLSLLFLLITACSVFFFVYSPVPDQQPLTNREISEAIGGEYKIALPKIRDDSVDSYTVNQKEDVRNNEEKSDTSNDHYPDKTDKKSEKHTKKTPNPTPVPSSNDKTAKEIREVYRPSFYDLEDQANTKLNNLLQSAYSDYQRDKKKGNSISYFRYYQKYKSLSDQLQSKTDAAFHVIYSSLVEELILHGYDASEASSFKKEYEQKKEIRKKTILKEAMKQIRR